MGLRSLRFVDLPEHHAPGGFDHAAVHGGKNLLYVAHTANDAVDVIDCASGQFLRSVPGLTGAAGALVSEERDLVFTSNRGEDMVSVFAPGNEQGRFKVPVGVRPNGLSFDPRRGLLLAANVGSPDEAGSFTLSVVDITRQKMIHSILVPGRTRWTVFDPPEDLFYVNIADPPRILVVEAAHPDKVTRELTVPAAGPHGLDLDADGQILYCACDAGKILALAPSDGAILQAASLSGTPDVIFFNQYLLPPSPMDWLPASHLAYFILDVVEQLNLGEIAQEVHQKNPRGERPYAIGMMVGLLLYGYSVGIYSSRRIARATYEDVAFRVISGGEYPHFTTINQFRLDHGESLGRLFVEGLRLCQAAGLVKLGLVALDGAKIKAAASKHKAMSYKRMNEEESRLQRQVAELLRRAEQADRKEDELYGSGQDKEDLPAERPDGRRVCSGYTRLARNWRRRPPRTGRGSYASKPNSNAPRPMTNHCRITNASVRVRAQSRPHNKPMRSPPRRRRGTRRAVSSRNYLCIGLPARWTESPH